MVDKIFFKVLDFLKRHWKEKSNIAFYHGLHLIKNFVEEKVINYKNT